MGIYPAAIAGASIGALVVSLSAVGYNSDFILDLIKNDKLDRINRLMTLQSAFGNTGMSNHKNVQDILMRLFPVNNFSSMKMPYFAAVTNIADAESVIVSKGNNMIEYIIASTSIPGVFEAVNINDVLYVDGGVLNNLPAQPLKEICDVIIGIDVLPLHPKNKADNSFYYMLEAMRIMQHQNSQPGRDICDYVIEPRAIDEYHEFSFDKYREIYQYGYQAAQEYMRKNPEMVKRLTKNKKTTSGKSTAVKK